MKLFFKISLLIFTLFITVVEAKSCVEPDTYNANLMLSANRWGFNGKEKQTTGNLNYMDYGARMYDDFTGRWFVQDPLQEKYYPFSSYSYCVNNPIKFIDPDGMQAKDRTTPAEIRGMNLIRGRLGAFIEKHGWNKDIRTIGYAIQHSGEAKYIKNVINLTASNFEINITKAAGLTRGVGTHGNAIRHTLWQAILTKEFGQEHAIRIGNVHEDNPNMNLEKREFKTEDEADQAVDLLNNTIGRDIAGSNEGASNVELATEVMTEYKNNGLWTVSGNQNNGYTIQKTKITNTQYDAAIKEINKKGENGLNK